MQKITPFLWFNDKAEEAINFYTSLFKDGKIISIARYPDSYPGMGGKILTAVFQIDGQELMAIDGGPMYKFTEAISLMVGCDNQAEVDYLWDNLTKDGGEEIQCGWLKDKYGLTWQIIPAILPKLLTDPDKEKSGRAMQAMLKMKKIDCAVLQQAFDGN